MISQETMKPEKSLKVFRSHFSLLKSYPKPLSSRYANPNFFNASAGTTNFSIGTLPV